MGGIKYYQLAKGEELPDEFCVVRDVGGEPSEYTFYVPECENARLRELCKEWYIYARELFDEFVGEPEADAYFMTLEDRLRKMGMVSE